MRFVMKQRYQTLTIEPLEFSIEGNLLQASIVTEEAMVTTSGQKVEEYDFNDGSFNLDWE